MNTTKRIEKTVEALDKKQLKNALSLTDRPETARHHQWVEEAARTCLTNKGDKARCDAAIKEAKTKIEETISLPLEDTSLEGVEEMIGEPQTQPEAEKSEEELYAECEECHVANAVVQFHEISEHCLNEPIAQRIERLSEENTAPEKWLKELKQIRDKAECGRDAYDEAWDELHSYLEERGSPILQGLEEGNG
jgi:hypothetical protein